MTSAMNLYIIECRKPDGSLDLTGPQPESVFGMGGIQGISEDVMAKRVWAVKPDATLDGQTLLRWPALIDPRWIARRKTW